MLGAGAGQGPFPSFRSPGPVGAADSDGTVSVARMGEDGLRRGSEGLGDRVTALGGWAVWTRGTARQVTRAVSPAPRTRGTQRDEGDTGSW